MLYIYMLGSCVFRTALPRTGGRGGTSHLKRGGLTLHDAVRINCKNYVTIDNKEQVPSIWSNGCVLDNCMCVHNLT